MLDNYQDLIDELLGTPRALREAVAVHGDNVDPRTRGLITALAERDALVLDRLNGMRREANFHARALPSAGALDPAAADEPITPLLERFDHGRGDLVSLLMNLTLKDWERTATHEIDGEVTIADEVEAHVEFDETMRARIEAALR